MELPPDHTASAAVSRISIQPPIKSKRRLLPYGCVPALILGFVVMVLAALVLPSTNSVGVRGVQTKALAQSKQIGLALKLFAGDHDGHYPIGGVPAEMSQTPINSNQAFACLFPIYTQSESIFGNKLSAYSSAKGPDNVIDHPYTGHPVETLRPGENVYGYVMGLIDDKSDPQQPLIVDGTDGTGHYNTREHGRGSIWKGTKAIVIRLDNSGAVQTLAGPADARYIPDLNKPAQNILDPASLGKDVRYLDPAFPPLPR